MTDEKDMEMSPDAEPSENVSADRPEAVDDSSESPVAEEDKPAVEEAEASPEAEAVGDAPADELVETPGEQPSVESDESEAVNDRDANDPEAEAAMMAMLEDLPEEDAAGSPDDINFGSAPVSSVEFQQLQEPASSPEPRNIDLLMDVDLPVSIELGRTKMPISDILALGPGSVVELNKLAGEPVDLLINYKVVARGEVVVVDENFGLRITQLMTPEERLKALADE
ncbi:MAG: flagellar motor switch protein FliN [Candidatus Zixiibacteriota bacterium]|nr:MAG: flagellar motor switch protein FliN [candidate division Zixibacteria bacterium]